jgi:large subunit ribosomal protein L10
LPTQRKIEQVAELEEIISRSTVAIGGDYRGLTVADMGALRRKMREAGIEVKVVKNTLLERAAAAQGQPDLVQVAKGPTAVLFGSGDGVNEAKAITEFIRATRSTFALYGGYAEGRILDAAQVQELATLPGKGALLSQLMGALQSPIANLAGLLSATLREFAGLVDARANQLESQA